MKMRQTLATNCLKLSQTLLNLASSCRAPKLVKVYIFSNDSTLCSIFKLGCNLSFRFYHYTPLPPPQILLYVHLAKYFLLVSLPALGLEMGEQRPNLPQIFSLEGNPLCFEKGDSWFSKANLGV